MFLAITRKKIEELEDNNQHGEVALQLTKSFGTYREYEEVKEINKAHFGRGHILHDEQKRRDWIIDKYYDFAK